VLETCMRVAEQLRKDAKPSPADQIAMVYPVLALTLLGAADDGARRLLVPVFVGVFKEFGGELPKLTQISVLLSEIVTALLVGHLRRTACNLRLQPLEGHDWGRKQWIRAASHADGRSADRAADRRRALVTHARLAGGRRRAAAART